MSLLRQGGEGCAWMLLLQTSIFLRISLVVRARLTLDFRLLVSLSCRFPCLTLCGGRRRREGFPTIWTVVGHQPTSIVTCRRLNSYGHPIFCPQLDYSPTNTKGDSPLFTGNRSSRSVDDAVELIVHYHS